MGAYLHVGGVHCRTFRLHPWTPNKHMRNDCLHDQDSKLALLLHSMVTRLFPESSTTFLALPCPVLTSASKGSVPLCRQLNPATPPAATFSTAAATRLAEVPAQQHHKAVAVMAAMVAVAAHGAGV
jgi:hypothetical protein